MKTITDFPEVQKLLDECQAKVQEIIGMPVTISYHLKFHHVTTDLLAAIICDICEVEWNQIAGDSRKMHIKIARQLFTFFSYTVQKKTLSQIAIMLKQDHTSVIHNRDRIKAMIDTNDELYMPLYFAIEKRINEILIAA